MQDPPWGLRHTPSHRIHHGVTGILPYAGSTMGSQAYPHQDFWGNPSWDILELHKQGTRHSCFILFIFFFCVFCILPYIPLFAFKTRSCYYMAQASFRVLYLLRAGITVRHHHENFVCPVNGYTGRVVWLQKMKQDCDCYIKYSLSHSMYNTGSRHRSSQAGSPLKRLWGNTAV